MSGFLSVLAVEAAAVGLIIELLVRCMPRALQRASHANWYRGDGTISDHRRTRESQARNLLRRDLLAVFAYVLLIGNGICFLIDKAVMPIRLAFTAISLYSADIEQWKASLEERRVIDQLADWQRQNQTNTIDDSNASEISLRRSLPAVVMCCLLLAAAVFFFLRIGIMKAYREFARGVNNREQEYFKIDTTRMTTNGSEFAVEAIAAQQNLFPRDPDSA